MIIRLKKLILWVFDFCLIFKLVASFNDTLISSVAYLGYQIMVVCMLLLSCVSFLKSKEVTQNRRKLLFCLQFLVVTILYYTVFSNSALSEAIGQHVKAMLLYYIVVIGMVLSINTENDLITALKHGFFSIGIVMFLAFVLYNDGFEFVVHISDLFSRDTRYRWEYGFYHANFVGNLSAFILLLSFMIQKLNDKIRRSSIIKSIPYAIIDAVAAIMLIASASRSNMIGIVVFVLVYVFLNINNWLSVRRVFARFIQILSVVALVFCVIISGDSGTYDTLFKLSNRSLNFTINIPSLISSGRALFGLGYVDAGMFGSNRLTVSTWYVDNSYLYVFLTMGILGLCWFIWMLAKLLTKIIKYDRRSNKASVITSVFLTYLALGFSETCIFYPTFVTSFIYFVIFVSCAFLNLKETIEKGGGSSDSL